MLTVIIKHRAAVITSVIASLIFYFVTPILEFLGRSSLTFAQLFGDAYVDRIYSQAAHLETQDYSFMLYCMWLGAVFGSLAAVSFSLPRKRLKPVVNDELTLETLAAIVNLGDTPPRKGTSRSRIIAFRAIAVLALIWGALVIGANVVQLRTISTFRHHLTILAPFMDEEAEERLLSDWARIGTQAEYEQVCDKLAAVAEENGIVLPPNRLYSFFTL